MKRSNYLLIALLLIAQTAWSQTDSLGIERQGDQVFVVHKVLAQQTLYSLSRRYKTTVSEINKANPVLANGLQVGQTLKIPYGGEIISPDSEVRAEVETITHRVKAGETLFSIARKYDVQVSEVKSWNNLSSNAINLNQALEIRRKVLVPVEKETAEATEEQVTSRPKAVNTPDSVLVAKDPFEEKDSKEQDTVEQAPEVTSYPGTPFEPIEIEGLAQVIEESEPSNKFFALHKTAKVGTVIKVKNLMNDLTVYVRVIGSIPETSENQDIIIKLNQRAYDHLKAVDKRFRVQLNYFK